MKIYLGSEIKLNLSIDKIGSLSMSDYDFEVAVFCNPSKALTIRKGDSGLIKKQDDSNYVLMIDTMRLGIGRLKLQVTAQIPDTDFDDYLRKEIQVVDTGIEIIRRVI
jgi:hypothetical protein